MKSRAFDLASDTIDRVADVIHHNQETLSDATKSVGDDVSRAATKVLHSVSPSAVGDRVATASRLIASMASVGALVAALKRDDRGYRILKMMNLQRRPSGLSRVARGFGFAAFGASVGVGAALLLTPKTGAQLRAMIRGAFRGASAKGESPAEPAGAKVHEASEHVKGSSHEVANAVETVSVAPVTPRYGRPDASAGAAARHRGPSDGAVKS